MYIRRQITRLCLSCRETSCFAVTYVRLVAGYMLLYDDQGVSLVYGTLSRVAGVFHWWDTVKPYHLPSFLLNDEQKDDRPKWQTYGIFASPKKPGPRVHKYPETIHIYWVLWSTEAKESCMRIVTTPRVLQLMRTMPARQGPAKGAYWTTQTKSETRSVRFFAYFCNCWWNVLAVFGVLGFFPSGAGGSPRNRYQHLWCTQCGNHQGVTPGCQINVSFWSSRLKKLRCERACGHWLQLF